jgi:hypothetical protein
MCSSSSLSSGVAPGLFGTMQVKWLTGPRFETSESSNFYHATEYRVPNTRVEPGTRFRFTTGQQHSDLEHPPDELHPRPSTGRHPGTGRRHRQWRCLQRRLGTPRRRAGVVRPRSHLAAGRFEQARARTPGTSGPQRPDSTAARTRSGHGPSMRSAETNRSTVRSTGTRTATSGTASTRPRDDRVRSAHAASATGPVVWARPFTCCG